MSHTGRGHYNTGVIQDKKEDNHKLQPEFVTGSFVKGFKFSYILCYIRRIIKRFCVDSSESDIIIVNPIVLWMFKQCVKRKSIIGYYFAK